MPITTTSKTTLTKDINKAYLIDKTYDKVSVLNSLSYELKNRKRHVNWLICLAGVSIWILHAA